MREDILARIQKEPQTIKFRALRRLWAMSLILLLLICTVREGICADTLSLNEYGFRIQESIEHLESGQGEIQSEEISLLQGKFPPGLKVRYIKGETVRVDRKGLLLWIHKAQGNAQDRDRLIVHLKALHRQLSWEARHILSTGLSWEKSRVILDEIYRDRQFMHLSKVQRTPWKAFIERTLQALGKWLREHKGVLDHVPGKWIQYPAYGVILILSGILIVWILRSFGLVGWHRRQPSIKPSPPSSRHEPDWSAWRDEARKKALEGAFREAIRSLFVSVLMEGHERGWWVYEPKATNKEHLARVEGPSERRAALQKLVVLYERTWYGLGKPGKEEYRDCEEWVRQMEAIA
jgi:hypothetical protein